MTSLIETVYIWSPDFSGHHLFYASLISQHFLDLHQPVYLVATAEGLESAEFSTHFCSVPVRTMTVDSLKGLVQSASLNSCVVVLHGDHQLPTVMRLQIPCGKRLRVLVMRPPRTLASRRNRLAKATLIRITNVRRRRRVLELRAIFDRPGRPNSQVPDPVVPRNSPTDRSKARLAIGLQIPDSAIVGGVLGVVSSRKYPQLLLKALDQLAPNHHVLLAGQIDGGHLREEIASALTRHPGQIHVRDMYLSADQFANCLGSTDYVAVLHSQGISSGVALQAIEQHKPLIVGDGTELATFITSNQLGISVPLEVHAMAEAMHTVVSVTSGATYPTLPSAMDFVASLVGTPCGSRPS